MRLHVVEMVRLQRNGDCAIAHQLEVPDKVRVRERRNKPARRRINVDINRKSLLLILFTDEPIHLLDIFVLSGIRSPKNCTYEDRVFID
jgi:hypothetical protein